MMKNVRNLLLTTLILYNYDVILNCVLELYPFPNNFEEFLSTISSEFNDFSSKPLFFELQNCFKRITNHAKFHLMGDVNEMFEQTE